MKTKLTKEESQYLISLGVPKEKASGIDTDNFENMFLLAVEAKTTGNGDKSIRSLSTPIFKLEDFLNDEILPKDVLFDENDEDSVMEFGIIHNPILKEWNVYYSCLNDKYRGVNIVKRTKKLIDSLYQLTCWYYGEYLKKEKK